MLPLLISSIDANDKKDFYTNLYRQYYPTMSYLAYRITKDYSTIPDIIQDTLVSLLKYYDKLHRLNEAFLVGYIALTVKSSAILFMRKRSRDWSYYGPADDIADCIPDPVSVEQVILQRERHQELVKAMDLLKESDRDLLLYKYILEKPNGELATLFETNEVNIRQRLSRARRQLAHIIQSLEGS